MTISIETNILVYSSGADENRIRQQIATQARLRHQARHFQGLNTVTGGHNQRPLKRIPGTNENIQG